MRDGDRADDGRPLEKERPMIEPQQFTWLIPDRLAVAERPGGGGRSHRVARREAELAWWQGTGVTTIISAMRSRHGLLESALAGFRVVWHPLIDTDQGAREIPRLVDAVREALDRGEVVLVHADRPGEWTAAVAIALRVGLGLDTDDAQAALAVAAAGFPVGEITDELLGRTVSGICIPASIGPPA